MITAQGLLAKKIPYRLVRLFCTLHIAGVPFPDIYAYYRNIQIIDNSISEASFSAWCSSFLTQKRTKKTLIKRISREELLFYFFRIPKRNIIDLCDYLSKCECKNIRYGLLLLNRFLPYKSYLKLKKVVDNKVPLSVAYRFVLNSNDCFKYVDYKTFVLWFKTFENSIFFYEKAL